MSILNKSGIYDIDHYSKQKKLIPFTIDKSNIHTLMNFCQKKNSNTYELLHMDIWETFLSLLIQFSC